MGKGNSAKQPDGVRGVSFLVICSSLSLAVVVLVVVGRAAPEPQRRPQTRRPARRVPSPPRINYAKFSHVTHVQTQKLACDSCHKLPTKNWKEVRKGEAAFEDVADFPEHSTCINCHRQQFFARERPAPAICSNCHVNVTPRDTTRFLFPSLGDVADSNLKRRESVSEFGVGFPHDKHVDVVGFDQSRPATDGARFVRVSATTLRSEAPKSCPVCHQTYQPQGDSSDEYVTKPPKTLGDNFWLKKGTFQTIPNSHSACFTCHNAESGIPPDSKDCQSCHKLLPVAKLKVDFDPKLLADMGINDNTIRKRWSTRISSGAFRHEGGEHPALDCTSCHVVAMMNTLDQKTLKVAVRSCGGAEGCHITATVDDGGALNFEIDQKKADSKFVCTKCHISFGKEPVPANHIQALATAKK